jgi:hypothetical protein
VITEIDYYKHVSKCLTSFIRHNTKLLHLDLQSTGLNQQILIDIISGVKRAKSLLGLHLGFNPGVCDKLKMFWKQ